MKKEEIAILFRQHYGPMIRLARRMLYDDEESRDVVSEVFATLIKTDILPKNIEGLNVTLVASDLLRTKYEEGTGYGGIGYSNISRLYRDARRIGFNVSWKFNATRSRYKGSHAGQSERNRL